MALVLADRVLETTTTSGSGTITLAGAKPGYQSFAVVGNGNTTYYTIAGSTEWEVGIGTYTSSGTTLSRDTVLSSSSGGGKVTFSVGSKDVFVTYPAARSVESTSATITTLTSTSANITTLTGTTISATNMGAQATTQFQAASANITTATGTTFSATTMGAQSTTTFLGTSANITTATGTTFSATTMGAQSTTTFLGTSANITTLTGTSATITNILDGVGNVRNIPRSGSAKTSTYTLAITDIGEYIEIGTGGGIDVPNGIFSTGNAISVFNNTTGNRTISLTITTAYIAGTDADKNSVTLATRGVATILFISNSVCVVSGNVS